MKANIRAILENWRDFEWSLQGFGMLRTYLAPRVRLHVWHPELAFDGVSTIHDHPWDFESWVISGTVRNLRFCESIHGAEFQRIRIQCGEGGCALSEPEPVQLRVYQDETIRAGETYQQRAPELHESRPSPGCVSLIIRDFHQNTEEATVCFPAGEKWGSAEPRPATPEEVQLGIVRALAAWRS